MSEGSAEIRDDGALINAIAGPLRNPYSGMGVPGRDRSTATQITPAVLLGRREVADAYASDWICRKVVDAVADDATKKAPEFTLGGNEADLKRAGRVIAAVQQSFRELDVCTAFCEAARLERLYGGSVIIMGLDDGQDSDQPVAWGRLRGVRWLQVLDRWHVTGIGLDLANPDAYQISVGPGTIRLPDSLEAGMVTVHPSRVLRFPGEPLPPDLRRQNQGWGCSVLQRMISSWQQYRTATAAASEMLTSWDIFTHRIPGLSQLVAAGKEDAIRRRLEANSLGRSVWRSMLLDESEEVNWINRSIAGVDSVLEKLRDDLQGGTGIDHAMLFGHSPSGLGATGRLEERNFSKSVSQYQRAHLTTPLRTLTEVLLLSQEGPTTGRMPAVWDVAWPDTFEVRPEEMAALREAVARTDVAYIQNAVLTAAEVAAARFGGAEWSAETTLNRSTDAPAPAEATAMPNLISVVSAAAAGQIPRDAAVQLLMRLLGIPEPEAAQILASAGTDPQPSQPAPAPAQPDQQQQIPAVDHADAAEPMKVRGKPLSQRALNKLATISEEDIQIAVDDWNQKAPAQLQGMLEATADE